MRVFETKLSCIAVLKALGFYTGLLQRLCNTLWNKSTTTLAMKATIKLIKNNSLQRKISCISFCEIQQQPSEKCCILSAVIAIVSKKKSDPALNSKLNENNSSLFLYANIIVVAK